MPVRVALMLVVVLAAFASAPSLSADEETIDITLISLSAWNGEVSATTTTAGDSGGAATLAAYWQKERAANPNTLVLGTGNSFGTSPPISNLFDDEPAVFALSAMGLDADTLGNDNFGHGIAYLQRLLNIADYPSVSANLANVDQDLLGVPPYQIFELDGVKVAVIGITDPRSPSIVFPGNFGTIEVTDAYLAAYRAREQAAAEGAQVFVLITELVLTSADPAAGPLIDLANDLTGFDAILGNGDSLNYTAEINGARVVAGQNRGRSFARTRLRFDRAGGTATQSSTIFVQPLAANVTPDASIDAMLDVYRSQLSVRLSEVIATSSTIVGAADLCGQPQARFCESLTGNVVADAIRSTYDAEIAILNSGSLRAGITCPAVDSATDFCPAYQGALAPITEGQVEAVLPFTNFAITVTVTGAELKGMLENGVSQAQQAAGRFPQVSGFCFWYDISRAPGSRVLAAVRQGEDGACNGPAIDFSANASYALVTNDFVAAGGDGYAKPTAPATMRERLDTVLSDSLQGRKTISPRAEGRINCLGAGCPPLLTGSPLSLPSASTTDGAGVRPPSTGDGGLR